MKNNKFLILLFVVGLFFVNCTYSYGCEFGGEISRCIAANNAGKTKEIEEFVCITGTDEEIAYQVVLDMKFKELDDEMDKFIEDLEKNKSTYFGIERQGTYIDGINDMHIKKGYFYKEYKKKCGAPILNEVRSCMANGKVTMGKSLGTFKNSDCISLIDKKLEIFDDVTFSVLMLNKQQIKEDEKKTYDQGQKRNYNILIDIMMVNLGYLERIWQKWPTKILNTY